MIEHEHTHTHQQDNLDRAVRNKFANNLRLRQWLCGRGGLPFLQARAPGDDQPNQSSDYREAGLQQHDRAPVIVKEWQQYGMSQRQRNYAANCRTGHVDSHGQTAIAAGKKL